MQKPTPEQRELWARGKRIHDQEIEEYERVNAQFDKWMALPRNFHPNLDHSGPPLFGRGHFDAEGHYISFFGERVDKTYVDYATMQGWGNEIFYLPRGFPVPKLFWEFATCNICLEAFKTGDRICYTPCKHFFHKNCLYPWLFSNKTCPVCRTIIRK